MSMGEVVPLEMALGSVSCIAPIEEVATKLTAGSTLLLILED